MLYQICIHMHTFLWLPVYIWIIKAVIGSNAITHQWKIRSEVSKYNSIKQYTTIWSHLNSLTLCNHYVSNETGWNVMQPVQCLYSFTLCNP